MQRIF